MFNVQPRHEFIIYLDILLVYQFRLRNIFNCIIQNEGKMKLEWNKGKIKVK